jgi:hypothetical protein
MAVCGRPSVISLNSSLFQNRLDEELAVGDGRGVEQDVL